MMHDRFLLSDKVQDLLALEAMASEIYKEALKCPESRKHAESLTAILNDELAHIELVKRILERI